MAPVKGDVVDPGVEKSYLAAIRVSYPDVFAPQRIDRSAFYSTVISSDGLYSC